VGRLDRDAGGAAGVFERESIKPGRTGSGCDRGEVVADACARRRRKNAASGARRQTRPGQEGSESVRVGFLSVRRRGLSSFRELGQELEVSGTLTDTTTNAPIGGGSVLIYTTNLATDAVHLAKLRLPVRVAGSPIGSPPGPDRRVVWSTSAPTATRASTPPLTTTTAGSCVFEQPTPCESGRRCGSPGGSSVAPLMARVRWCRCGIGSRVTRAPGSVNPGRSALRGGFVIRYLRSRLGTRPDLQRSDQGPTQAGWDSEGQPRTS